MFRIILDYPAWGMEKENLILVPFSPVSINNSPFRLDCIQTADQAEPQSAVCPGNLLIVKAAAIHPAL